MPIYEYKCTQCENEFEKLVFGKEEIVCPKCGKSVEKLMSCCSFKSKDNASGETKTSSSSKSGCGTCSATSCASCH
jgi:putative FmdB family regulatory protein